MASSLKIIMGVRDCYRFIVVYKNKVVFGIQNTQKSKDKLMRDELLRQLTVSFDV